MNPRKFFYLFIALFVCSFVWVNPLHAQYNLDYGGIAGVSNYLGEIGGTKKEGKGTARKNFVADMRLDQTKFVIGGWVRYKVHPLFSAKAGLTFIRIAGVDSTSDYINRRGRNLSFRNDIYELNIQAEYNFYSVHNISPTGRMVIDFAAYGFVGGGMYWHNPKAEYLGKWWALQPIGTEGQTLPGGKKYSRLQGQVSTGLGFYYTFKRKWRIGWEFSVRKTFTDYLDDVSTRFIDPTLLDDGTPDGAVAAALANRSQNAFNMTNGVLSADDYRPGAIRGNPEKKDWYMFTVATVGYVVRGKGSFYKQKYQLLTGNKKRKKRKTRAKF